VGAPTRQHLEVATLRPPRVAAMWDHGTARRAGPASGAGFSVIKVAYVADRAAPGGVCRQHRISQVGYLIARLSSAFGTELLLGTAILRVGGFSRGPPTESSGGLPTAVASRFER
jgi:hypothetical protein